MAEEITITRDTMFRDMAEYANKSSENKKYVARVFKEYLDYILPNDDKEFKWRYNQTFKSFIDMLNNNNIIKGEHINRYGYEKLLEIANFALEHLKADEKIDQKIRAKKCINSRNYPRFIYKKFLEGKVFIDEIEADKKKKDEEKGIFKQEKREIWRTKSIENAKIFF